ncbi:MAG: 4-hydroxy-3-methylbut-2-enyl diphosphate reductase [Bacteroidales bacterium]
MKIEIDPKAGFCFGVTRVVSKAEEIIQQHGQLYCLGEIVHNQKEIERLEKIGLKTITYNEYLKLSNCRVLIRAHGEPPETYEYARKNNIELIDGTCPIVIRLQNKIKKDFSNNSDSGAQIVIFGKKDHAEVRGLAGQTNYQTLIIESPGDIDKIDFSRPVHLYAQTTMSSDKYQDLQQVILQKANADENGIPVFKCNKTICGQVSGRIPQLKEFCTRHDLILFVSYKQSSNGKLLFAQCQTVNENSHFINEKNDLQPGWFSGIQSVGITGATSTPRWLLEEIAEHVKEIGV